MSEEREILDAIAKAEAQEQRDILRRCDWEDPADVALLRSSDRLAARMRAIRRLCQGMRCPGCGDIVLRSRSWVLRNDGESAVCRSCFFRMRERGEKKVTIASSLVSFEEVRYHIEPHTLVLAREAAGIPQAEFARRAGWSRGWQRKLEAGERIRLQAEAVQTIFTVLREAGVELEDGDRVAPSGARQ